MATRPRHAKTPRAPFYGETYLPRKFKIAVAHPTRTAWTSSPRRRVDSGFTEAGDGFNLLVRRPRSGLRQSDTFARLADR